MGTAGDGAGPIPRWRRRGDVSWRGSLDGVVVQAPSAADPSVLLGTAAVVWSLLDEPITLDDLVDALVEVYGGDRSVIADDVEDLIAHMRRLDVVEAV